MKKRSAARRVRPSRLGQWWVHLPIRLKGLLVVAIPALTLAMTIVIRLPFNEQQQQLSALLSRAGNARHLGHELLFALQELELGVHGYVLTKDGVFRARFQAAKHVLPDRIQRFSAVLTTEDERRVASRATTSATRAIELGSRVIDAADAVDSLEETVIQALLHDEHRAMEEVRGALYALGRSHDSQVSKSQAELARLRQRLVPMMWLAVIGGLSGAVVAGWLFATGVSRRVRALEANAERLAKGERLPFAPSRGRDEIGSLDRALRRASLMLRTRDRELRSLNATLERTVHDQALLNRELEAFSYSVSHDLRAPLRSIDGFAQALREDWGDRLDETAQDHLSRVRNAAQRMGRLIDDLLKLSRLTRAQVNRTDVDLSQLAHEIAGELRERNPTRDVSWAIAPDLRAQCDPALARIMLENLLGNAWKFTSKTPKARIEFDVAPNSDGRTFVVRDNGAGFDMKYADKLFAPFQRLHGEREFPGSGIGLATVQRIIRKHGGNVDTRAEVGRGASFFFTLEPTDGAVAA
jgi:signal transduction histidine kinase